MIIIKLKLIYELLKIQEETIQQIPYSIFIYVGQLPTICRINAYKEIGKSPTSKFHEIA